MIRAMHFSVLLFLALCTGIPNGQSPLAKGVRKPIETIVCKIAAEPYIYNNRIVKVRGYVQASMEYSFLMDEHCSIWLAFGDGSFPPQVEAFVIGNGIPGSRDSKGKLSPPIRVQLLRDANYDELAKYLAVSAKGEACADEPPPDVLPDCTTYRVTATFTGRVDGVSKRIHEAHVKRASSERIDGKGFGHMGMFDAQLVVQSVQSVVAVNEIEVRQPATRH